MKPIIAVDFDGTLCENNFPCIGESYTDFINLLIKQREEGYKIILWTCRENEKLNEAIEWCKKQGLEFDAVNNNLPEIIEPFGNNTRKIFANLYIDDRGIHPDTYMEMHNIGII